MLAETGPWLNISVFISDSLFNKIVELDLHLYFSQDESSLTHLVGQSGNLILVE